MNIDTGELFENRDEAVEKSFRELLRDVPYKGTDEELKEKAEKSIVPITEDEYNEYSGMNREERRRIHREKLRAEKRARRRGRK